MGLEDYGPELSRRSAEDVWKEHRIMCGLDPDDEPREDEDD